jgi:hypothetical protein
MESEPARAAGAASNAAGRTRCGSGPPLSSMEGAPPARQRALKARGGLTAARLDTSIFLTSGTAQLVEGAALIQR